MNIDFIVGRRLRIFLLLAVMLYLAVHMSGCAQVEQFTDDHPQAVVVVELGALAVGGVILAKSIAKSGQAQTHYTPPVAPLTVPCAGPDCTR